VRAAQSAAVGCLQNGPQAQCVPEKFPGAMKIARFLAALRRERFA
jgi:hypothetical protein